MNDPLCDLRDGYLGLWLTQAERWEFEAHMAACAHCRQAIQDQATITHWLLERSPAVPPLLMPRVERKVRAARRRRLVAWGAGLAAATILLGYLVAEFMPRTGDAQLATTSDMESAREPVLPTASVQVTFPPSAEVIAVPRKTDNPRVTIIWLYPTVQTAHEPEANPSGSALPTERRES
jgi:hypothetical protein